MSIRRIRSFIKYAAVVIAHKRKVFRFGRATGAPLVALILHDWTKFLPREAIAYSRWMECGIPWSAKEKMSDPQFDKAWLSHQRHHGHHWQKWVLLTDGGEMVALQMPERFIREMVADWAAIHGSNLRTWLNHAAPRMLIHPATLERARAIVDIISFT